MYTHVHIQIDMQTIQHPNSTKFSIIKMHRGHTYPVLCVRVPPMTEVWC